MSAFSCIFESCSRNNLTCLEFVTKDTGLGEVYLTFWLESVTKNGESTLYLKLKPGSEFKNGFCAKSS